MEVRADLEPVDAVSGNSTCVSFAYSPCWQSQWRMLRFHRDYSGKETFANVMRKFDNCVNSTFVEDSLAIIEIIRVVTVH